MRLRHWLLVVPAIVVTAALVGTSTGPADAAAPSTVTLDAAPFAAPGPHAVGVRSLQGPASLPPLTHWYPAAPTAGTDGTTYEQELHLGGPLGAVTVGRVHGTAVPGAPPVTAGALGDAAPPLVVLAPGYGIGAASYAWLAEHLASHGFAVVAHDAAETLGSATGDGLWHAAVDRPATLAAVVDELVGRARPGGADEGAWDAGRVALLGHSFGGYAALAVGGARLDADAFTARCDAGDPDAAFACELLLPNLDGIAARAGLGATPTGTWPGPADDRVDAIVSLAGDAYLFDDEGLATVTAPVLAVGGSEDRDTPWALGPAMTFEHAGSARRVLVGLEGAEHMVVLGRCDEHRRAVPLVPMDLCEDADGQRTTRHDVVAHVTTSFLLDELTDDGAGDLRGDDLPALPGTTIETTGDGDA